MHKNGAGFTLLELVISISILSFGVIMLYGSFYNIFNATYDLNPKFIASYLSQEGIETIKNLRDYNVANNLAWNAGLVPGPCTSGCQLTYKTNTTGQLSPYNDTVFLGLNSDGLYSYDPGATPTIFKRKVTITSMSANSLKVESLVTWTFRGNLASFTTKQYLYNWD